MNSADSDADAPGTAAVLLARLRSKLRELGLFGTLGLIPKNLRRLAQVAVDEWYDWRHGVKTAGYTHLHELVIDSPNKELGIRYQPSTEKRLAAIFSNLPDDVGAYTFVDFGSGRGRVLLFAARRPFRRVIGVEFSRELHESAIANLARSRERRRCEVEPLHQDATQFVLPDGPLVLYFFDPFRDQVMQQVVDNIKASYERSRRKIVVLYLAPVHEDKMLASGVLHKVSTPELPYEVSLPAQYRFAMFETRP